MEKRDYSWPVFLILIGLMFLLNTTGVIGWEIWGYILRFWPILIIIIGINIVLGNSPLARVLEIFFTVTLLLNVFVISYIQYTKQAPSFLPSRFSEWVLKGGSGMFNLSTESVEEDFWIAQDEYENVEKRRFSIQMGASSFTVNDTEDIEDYINVNSKYPKSFRAPVLEREFEDGLLDISLEGASFNGVNLFGNESSYAVLIGLPEIVSDFDINLGAGRGELVLEEILIDNYIAEVGAGKLITSFDVNSIPSGDVRFLIGAGKMDLILPQRVGYVLEYELGVGNIKIDGEDVSGVSGGKGKYTSSNFDSADVKMSMYVTVGVGTFNIESK